MVRMSPPGASYNEPVVVAALLVSLAAATVPAQAPQPSKAAPSLAVPRLEEGIRPDGRLDEPVWQQAATLGDFVQREPHEGAPATERTEVFIFYNAHAVVIGARLHDSDPSRIVGSEYLRDADLDANDAFEVMLDTFHDGRNAVYFQTNPVGARRDALVRNEGESVNWEWDGVWDVAAARDAGGGRSRS